MESEDATGPAPPSVSLLHVLDARLGHARAAEVLAETALELGLRSSNPSNALAGVALVKLGGDAEKLASSLSWQEFEDFCANVFAASGYAVRRNVILTKPRRQIDLVAASRTLSLCVDCKHWKAGSGSSVAKAAYDQAERARMLRLKSGPGSPLLPMILTLFDTRSRLAEGVPIVPVLMLRSFLSSVSGFEEGLCYV